MTPLSMKMARSATSLAKAISCVTTSMVIPCSAKLRMTLRTCSRLPSVSPTYFERKFPSVTQGMPIEKARKFYGEIVRPMTETELFASAAAEAETRVTALIEGFVEETRARIRER